MSFSSLVWRQFDFHNVQIPVKCFLHAILQACWQSTWKNCDHFHFVFFYFILLLLLYFVFHFLFSTKYKPLEVVIVEGNGEKKIESELFLGCEFKSSAFKKWTLRCCTIIQTKRSRRELQLIVRTIDEHSKW